MGLAGPLPQGGSGRGAGRHFARVERRDVDGWVKVDPDGARRWVESLGGGARPGFIDAPVRARVACAILVAET